MRLSLGQQALARPAAERRWPRPTPFQHRFAGGRSFHQLGAESGNNPVVSGQAESGEERKVATVLFADLAGSTALASDEDPERVRLRLERFYEAMAGEIETAGGTVEKFAGDAVMAVFGVPAALEDHASARCTQRSRCRGVCRSSSEKSPYCASASIRERSLSVARERVPRS